MLFQLGSVSGPAHPQGFLPIVPALVAGGQAAITGCAASVACAAFVGGALGTSIGLTAIGEGNLVEGAAQYNQNVGAIGQYIAVQYPETTETVQYVASLPGQGFTYALDTVGGEGTSEAFNQNVEAFDQWLHFIGYTGDVREVANAFATNMSLGSVATGGVALAGNAAKKIRVGNTPHLPNFYHASNSPTNIQNILNGINPRFLNSESRFGKAFYIGNSAETVIGELTHHGVSLTHAIRYKINDRQANILDLTNPEIAKKWNYFGGEITNTTRNIGQIAKDQGFNVIKYNSERFNGGINHAVLSDFKEILKPEIVIPTSP